MPAHANYYRDYDLELENALAGRNEPRLSELAVQGIAYADAVFTEASRDARRLTSGAFKDTFDNALMRARVPLLTHDFKLANWYLLSKPWPSNFSIDRQFGDIEYPLISPMSTPPAGPLPAILDTLGYEGALREIAYEAVQEAIGPDPIRTHPLTGALVATITGAAIIEGKGNAMFANLGGRPRDAARYAVQIPSVRFSKNKKLYKKAYEIMDRAQKRYLAGFSLYLTGLVDFARAYDERIMTDVQRQMLKTDYQKGVREHEFLYGEPGPVSPARPMLAVLRSDDDVDEIEI